MISKLATLLISSCSFHFWRPFCTATYYYDWHGHVTVLCKGPIESKQVWCQSRSESPRYNYPAFLSPELRGFFAGHVTKKTLRIWERECLSSRTGNEILRHKAFHHDRRSKTVQESCVRPFETWSRGYSVFIREVKKKIYNGAVQRDAHMRSKTGSPRILSWRNALECLVARSAVGQGKRGLWERDWCIEVVTVSLRFIHLFL